MSHIDSSHHMRWLGSGWTLFNVPFSLYVADMPNFLAKWSWLYTRLTLPS